MSTGKGTKSIRKNQSALDIIPSVGFLNTVAKHKATAGQTTINLGSLTTPPEASALGFIQPSGGALAAMDLSRFKKNVVVSSTSRGLMDNPIDYQITGQQELVLTVPALDGEIFTITIEAQPKGGINLVAAQPKVQSYMLPVGQTDIPAGVYTVNKNPGEDVGEFMVIVDRQLMYRNTSNGTSGGDYQELTGIIRLNDADLVNIRKVTMVWVGALVDNPQDSQLALVQTLAGQIDSMIPTLAALAGVPTNTFQAAPNDPDLVAFGAEVIAQAARILALETTKITCVSASNVAVSTIGQLGTPTLQIFADVRTNIGGGYNSTTGIFTCPAGKGGRYSVDTTITTQGAATAVNSAIEIHIIVNGSVVKRKYTSAFTTSSCERTADNYTELDLVPGDQVWISAGQNHNGGTLPAGGTRSTLDISRIGN